MPGRILWAFGAVAGIPQADTEGNSAKVARMIQTQSIKPATDFTA